LALLLQSMDFDTADEPQSFDEAVAAAKLEILRGLSVGEDWSRIVERSGLFKEVAREGSVRGQLFGTLLVAVRGLTCAIQRLATDDAKPAVCSSPEAVVLCSYGLLFRELFRDSPVPSTEQWRTTVRAMFAPATSAAGEALTELVSRTSAGSAAASGSPSRDSSSTNYMQHVVDELNTTRGSATLQDADDGSFVEAELKLFLRRVVLLARKCARLCAESEANQLRQMVNVVSQYVNNGTLEW